MTQPTVGTVVHPEVAIEDTVVFFIGARTLQVFTAPRSTVKRALTWQAQGCGFDPPPEVDSNV